MKILFIAVHPDDETLGCGGTILKHKAQGDDISWMIFTEAKGVPGYSDDFCSEREKQILKIQDIYGFGRVFRLGFQAARLHEAGFNDVINKVSGVMEELKPDVVYMINRSDIHTDHQVAAKAIFSCLKPFRYPFVKKVLMYECLSETEASPVLPENAFIPNVYSDISEYMDRKIEAMKVFVF